MSAEVVPGGRFAEQWRGAGRRVAPVEVVDAQRPTGLVRHLGVMRVERAVGWVGEAFLRRSQGLCQGAARFGFRAAT